MASEPELPDMTAAELALGLLDGEERAAALRRMLAEPGFARDVEEWRHRLAGLFDDYPSVAAPAAVAKRLARPAAQPTAKARSGGWPFIALLTAMAAAIALFLVARPVPTPVVVPPQHGYMVAALTLSDKSASVPAVIDTTTGEVRIAGSALAPKGKSAQLWMIASDGVPKPMGLLATDGPSHITLAAAQRAQLAAGITLAISIEPAGGSPTGKPTGPVVATGALSLA